MKFYTKEWYALMQQQDYTTGMKKLPDRVYTDEDIQTFYDKDLKAEIARARKIHNTPPGPYDWEYELLAPDRFTPDTFLFENEETGELFHPETPEIARHYLEQERRQAQGRFAARLSTLQKPSTVFRSITGECFVAISHISLSGCRRL